MIDELSKNFPKDTGINSVILPIVHGLLDMNRGNMSQAIDDTQPAMPYELGSITGYWLNYFRGQIYLKGKMGNEAAAEFRKILDHRGIEPFPVIYALSHVGLARASMLTGDSATARTEYQNFFAAWKDADQDLPILIDAKKEYDQIK